VTIDIIWFLSVVTAVSHIVQYQHPYDFGRFKDISRTWKMNLFFPDFPVRVGTLSSTDELILIDAKDGNPGYHNRVLIEVPYLLYYCTPIYVTVRL